MDFSVQKVRMDLYFQVPAEGDLFKRLGSHALAGLARIQAM